MPAQQILASVIFAGLTLYMMALLLRWLGPRLEIEFSGPWALLPSLCDPFIELMRKVLPPMGPMDWSPIAAVVCVYIVRLVIVGY